MKNLLVSLLLLFAPALAFARGALSGYAEQGGQAVSMAGFQSTTKVQKSFPSSTITVYLTGTTTLATIYTNAAGTIKGNPFTAGTDGSWLFYVDSCVDVRFSGTGITTPFTYTNLCPAQGAVNTFDIVTYGADPTNITNSSTAIQAAVTAACAVSGTVTGPEGIFKINTQLLIDCPGDKAISFIGASTNYTGTGGTTFRAGSAITSVLNISQSYSLIQGLRIDANRLANYGVLFTGCVGTRFVNGLTTNALLDGFHSDGTSLNQGNETDQWFSISNGKTYATAAILAQYANNSVRQTAIAGTASMVAANDTITIAGGPDLTTLGIRTGYAGDMVRVGSTAATAFYGQITGVTATTITLHASLQGWPTQTLAGQDYAIGIGWGWYEELNGGNGYNDLHNSWFRGNGAGGVFMNGLYGDHVRASACDFNNFSGIAMGLISNSTLLYESTATTVYMEANIGPDYVLGSASSAKIDTPGGGSAIFSIGGTQPIGIIIRAGMVESMSLGKPQNFIVRVNNNGGTFRHQTIADYFAGWASTTAGQVVGQSATYGNTPTLTGGATAFVNGFGFFDNGGGLNYLVIDTANIQPTALAVKVYTEFSDAGNYRAGVTTTNFNINGITKTRLAIVLVNSTTGAFIPWTAANIAGGTSVAVRFDGYIK